MNRLILNLAVGVCLALAGCDRSAAPPSTGTAKGPDQVRLGYFANVTHAQAVMGVASGEFAEAIKPAKLTTRVFNAGPSLIEALFAGEVDIGYVGPGPALSAQVQSRGQGIRLIAGAADNGVLIVARKDSGIEKLTDLKGRKIATPQLGNTQDIAARHYVVSVLKQPDASNIMPVANGEQASLMARGQIDAAWAPEPWGSRLIAETGARLIGKEEDLWPNKTVNLTVVVTTPEFLAGYPQVVEKMLRVHAHWTKRLAAEPQKYAGPLNDALAGLTGKKLPAGVVESSLKNVKFSDEPPDESLATMGQWAFELGFLARPPELKGFADLTLLRRLRAEK
ncbi:MAG: aliphatic sulfonate ABC transporter substrate-binding protein [Tepidisphaerales bacterium]